MSIVQLRITYRIGSLVVLRASFTRPPTADEITAGTACDVDDWQPVDPDTVSAWLLAPDETQTLHDYLGSPEDIVRDDVGEYHLDVTPDQSGVWYFGFVSTGVGQAAGEFQFSVEATKRLP
jgi:hypothetical protein